MLKLLKGYLQAIMITNVGIYRDFLFVYNRYAPRLFRGYITQTSYDTQAVPSRTTWRRPLMVRQPYSVAVPSTGGRLHPLVP